MKNILFVSYGGGHVTNLLPVYRELSHFSSVNSIFLALTTAPAYLDRFGVNYIGYKDFPFELPSENKENAVILLNQLQNQPISPEESLAYIGWNMWDLEQQYGKKSAYEKYKMFGRAAFYPTNLMKMILEFYSVDIVVATSSPRSERAAIDAASKIGIPAVCIPDSVANHELDLWIADNNFGSLVCAANEGMKNRLINHGRLPQSIAVTGSPALEDFMLPYEEGDIIKIKTKLGIPLSKKTILYASSPESSKHVFTNKIGDTELPCKVLNALITYVSQQDITLIYRPHPSLINQSTPSFNENVYLDQGNDLKEIISCSDIVVTTASTVGVQAQLLGKMLICVNLSIYSSDLYYEDFGPCRRVNSFEQFPDVLNAEISKINDKKVNKTIQNNLFSSPVKNVMKAINLVGELQIDV